MKLSIIDAVDVVVVFGRGACPDPVDADAKGGRERMELQARPWKVTKNRFFSPTND